MGAGSNRPFERCLVVGCRSFVALWCGGVELSVNSRAELTRGRGLPQEWVGGLGTQHKGECMTVFVWDSYPSDRVQEHDVVVPVKPDSTSYSPETTIRLIDVLVAEQINQSVGENPQVKQLDDGTWRLVAEFGRLEYSLYWHPTDPAKAKANAARDLQLHHDGRN